MAELIGAWRTGKQGAQDWYRRKVTEQAKYVPDFHDNVRAVAVLDGE